MKYADLLNAKDRSDLKRAEKLTSEGQLIRRRVMARLRARAYRRKGVNK